MAKLFYIHGRKDFPFSFVSINEYKMEKKVLVRKWRDEYVSCIFN